MWAFTVITRTKGKRHSAAGIPEKLSIGQCRFGTFCLRCRKTDGSILGLCNQRNLGDKAFIESVIQIIEGQAKEMATKENSEPPRWLVWDISRSCTRLLSSQKKFTPSGLTDVLFL